MKYCHNKTKLLFTFIAMLLLNIAYAQIPNAIPYQAVARNSSGAILASTNISVRFTVRDSTATGVIKYRETHAVTTSVQGMFSLSIGQGTPVTGTFNGINWGVNSKFMQLEIDPTGGSSYIDMGTQQMLSVPYALYAGSAGNISNNGSSIINNVLITTNTPVYTPNGVSVYTGGGNIICDGGKPVLQRGVCWSTSPSPTAMLSTKTNDSTGVGNFVSNFGTVLNTATTYYVRAYLINSVDTFYGNEVSFTTLEYALGLTFRGGVIAYILQSSDIGYVAGETHGLIISQNVTPTDSVWGCYGYAVGGTSTAFGTGAANTALISSSPCGASTAARLCADLVVDGYVDWYLPSSDELLKIINNTIILGLSTYDPYSSCLGYMSSSESGAIGFYAREYCSGYINSFPITKDNHYYSIILATRSF
jgi:hypothetical protein